MGSRPFAVCLRRLTSLILGQTADPIHIGDLNNLTQLPDIVIAIADKVDEGWNIQRKRRKLGANGKDAVAEIVVAIDTCSLPSVKSENGRFTAPRKCPAAKASAERVSSSKAPSAWAA